jgi:hypothetical protein
VVRQPAPQPARAHPHAHHLLPPQELRCVNQIPDPILHLLIIDLVSALELMI